MAHQARSLQFVKVKGNVAQSGALHKAALSSGYGGMGGGAVSDYGTKYATENLSFPLNVEGDSQEGHYIIFTVKEQNRARLKAFKPKQGASRDAMAKELGVGGPGFALTQKDRETYIDKAIAERAHADLEQADGATTLSALAATSATRVGLNNSIQMIKGATTDLKATISLYMPASVSVSYSTKYGDQEIGLLAETGAAAIKNFMETEGSTMEAVFAGGAAFVEGAGQGLKKWGIKALDTVAPGAAALIAISRGKIITPRMELMFEGVGRREFSYSFTMIPKSEQEADSIEGIVTRFKHAMAADYSTGNIADIDHLGTGAGADGVREMDIPSFFDIIYMYKGKENNHLNKISTCVLTKMDVEYGADRFKTYRGGVPQTTKISLSFSELNIITKKHIEVGY